MKSEVFTVMKIHVMVFWVVTPFFILISFKPWSAGL
jgi:hypothetical protein